MASSFSHAFAAFALGKVYPVKKPSPKFLLLGMLCAAIPDIDAIGYWAGVPYESMFGHRGITHSFFFAFVLAGAVMKVFYSSSQFFSRLYIAQFIYFFFAAGSHGILDAMTNGGMGVAFLAPFSNARYFFPFRPVLVSPISISRFFSGRGAEVLVSEFIWIWIPSLVLIASSFFLKGTKKQAESNGMN